MKSVVAICLLLLSIHTSAQTSMSTGPAEKPDQTRPQASYRLNYESLSQDDREILARGEISTPRYVIGGILGTYPLGFGIGHAIQGRYLDRGWIFTATEAGAVLVAAAGIGDCLADSGRYGTCEGGMLALGVAGFIVARVWEIIDLWAVPPELNRRYRSLKSRMGESVSFQPALIPLADAGNSRLGGAALGLRMTF